MLTEMLGKGGQVCGEAKKGHIRCPLIVRPTSEDQITGEVFQLLRFINPRHWVAPLLNSGLRANRFRKSIYRKFRIGLWENLPTFPRKFAPCPEGSTQVDAMLSWEDPSTTVFLEMKFGSPLSKKTSADDGTTGYPSDQLIRNIRNGLWQCGWLTKTDLLKVPPRDFVVLVVSPSGDQPLVEKYRSSTAIEKSLSCREELVGLPKFPFVGSLSFLQIAEVLRQQLQFLNHTETLVANDIIRYLEFKHRQLPILQASRPSSVDLQLTDSPALLSTCTT